ncbi:MAG: CRISPR-associated endonuclease Cas2 [Verrucomicrobiia bacterium]
MNDEQTTSWIDEAFPLAPYKHPQHPPGEKQMLTIVAYDIADPKRLVKLAQVCEDFGCRVQYSIFECRLEADRFDEFWLALQLEIDPEHDRLVAYKVCASCARQIETAGCMVCSEKAVAYVL